MTRWIAALILTFCYTIAWTQNDLNEKAVELMEQEQWEDALKILDPLVKEFPSVTSYRYNRAVTLFATKDYKRCVDDYKVLLTELPETEYVFQIGNAYEQMDSLGRAIEWYTKALAQDDSDYVTFFKRGTVFLKQKNFSKAIADFSRSIELNPHHGNSYHNRGIALYQSKKHQDACNDWCEASRLGVSVSAEHINKNCRNQTPCQ